MHLAGDTHPFRPAGALDRRPKPARPLKLRSWPSAPGAHRWLIEAAAVGTARIEERTGEAVDLAAVYGGV